MGRENLLKKEKKIAEAKKQSTKEEKENMDAKSAHDIIKNLENFGGVFTADQLKDVKILGLPVMLLILDSGHWISLYMDEKNLEIMDSEGFMVDESFNKHLCRFLCAHSYGKTLTVTPKLQNESSSDCGKYATSFLFYRAVTGQSLKTFAAMFSKDYEENSQNIEKIYKTIQDIRSNRR